MSQGTMYGVNQNQLNQIATALLAGQVGVIPTDTIYGIVGRADTPAVVERIYKAKGRNYNKPFIILISSVQDLELFDIDLPTNHAQLLRKTWPAPISVVLPCPGMSKNYLSRGKDSLAVRMPALDWLLQLISITGPLVATSANISGQTYKSDMAEIQKQLPNLDFYVKGHVSTEPSKLARLKTDGSLEWLARN